MKRWILVLLIGLTINRSYQSGDDMSGDGNEDEEGSAATPDLGESIPNLTPCQRQQQLAENDRKLVGAFRPQCTTDGEFRPMQCHVSTGRCWCVDKEGREIEGSMQVAPSKPRCTGRAVIVPSREPLGAKPSASPERHSTMFKYVPSDGDDIVIDDMSTSKPVVMEKTTERKSSKMSTTISSDVEVDHSDDSINAEKQSPFLFIFKDPLILAGIIGGAVLALLCIVLLIMFTIYRMRKKDEGSYALDEPKKSYGFAYTRAKDQEFFA